MVSTPHYRLKWNLSRKWVLPHPNLPSIRAIRWRHYPLQLLSIICTKKHCIALITDDRNNNSCGATNIDRFIQSFATCILCITLICMDVKWRETITCIQHALMQKYIKPSLKVCNQWLQLSWRLTCHKTFHARVKVKVMQ